MLCNDPTLDISYVMTGMTSVGNIGDTWLFNAVFPTHPRQNFVAVRSERTCAHVCLQRGKAPV
jgi:hypothetical protein